jgi:S1-C subfamily serine protease
MQQAANTPIQRGQGLYPWCPPGGPVGRMQQAANTPIQRGQGLYPWCPPGGRLQQAANIQTEQVWLGMRVNTVTDENRASLNLPMAAGVIVMEVFANSPSEAVGLERGDVIIRADNRSIKDEAMLESILNTKKPGDTIKLTIYREGKKINFEPVIGAQPAGLQGAAVFGRGGLYPWCPPAAGIQAQAVALPAQPAQPTQPFDPENAVPPGLTGILKGGEVGAGEIEALGMGVEELVPELAMAYGIPKGKKGLVIAETGGQAQAAGLLAGDVIEVINNQRVKTIVDFIEVMNKADLQKGISLVVYRQGQRFRVTMKG